MKPILLSTHTPEGKPHAFLVDEDSVFIKPEAGKQRLHYATAIDLRECMAGQLALSQPDENGTMRILAPNPCVLVMRGSMKKIGFEARHLEPKAAEVMLRLAAAAQNIQVPFNGSMTWTFGESIQRTDDPSIMAGATIQKLIAAWKWSHWQRHSFTRAQRLVDMRRIGYRGTAGALRDMMSNIGLVATKRK